jgi:hypothetical protein
LASARGFAARREDTDSTPPAIDGYSEPQPGGYDGELLTVFFQGMSPKWK